MVMVPAENGMRSFSAGTVFVCRLQSTSTSGVACRAVDLRAVDLWGRFVEARVTNASENGMIKSTILKDIGRLSFLEPRARVTATLLEPEARVKQQRRNE